MRADLRLLGAALPALAASLLLMRQANAGAALLTQQIAVAVVSFAAVALTPSPLSRGGTSPRAGLALAIATVLLWAPVWVTTLAGPERWLRVAGVRVYVASMLLPAVVLVLARALRPSATPPRWPGVVLPTALFALAAQPDASQATAFALACALPLWRASARATTKGLLATALAAGVVWAWWKPDPLLPVPYVEGVLDLAAAEGPVAFATALAALALPVLMLARQARTLNDAPLLSVAIYYVAIAVLAWRQLTPMPLLGFGAGPIVGWALMAALARRRS